MVSENDHDLNFKCHSKGSELSGKFDIVVNLIYIYFFFISKYNFFAECAVFEPNPSPENAER